MIRKLWLFVLVGAAGCAASGGSIRAPDAKYPVSFSPAVRDAAGNILSGDQLAPVGKFHYEFTTLHMIWGIVPLGWVNHDLSHAINEQVGRSKGAAIVNCRLTSTASGWSVCAAFLSLGILPTNTSVEVDGDIVVQSPAPR